MSRHFEGQVVVVTGATGMAAATVERVAAAGASVFVVSRDEGECVALCRRVAAAGGTAASATADLRDEAATEAAFAAAIARFGHIDGLFAVAGASGRRFGDGPLHEMPLEGWRETFERNAVPTFLAAREAVRAMLARGQGPGTGPGGSLVLMSSVLARRPSPELFATHAYAAAKGAVGSLVTTLAAYYAPEGIRVNAVAPSLVATPMAARAAEDPVTLAYATRKQPLAGGMLAASDVAGVAYFLLSPAAWQVTGQVIEVDGGWGVTEAGGRP
jgi:NAD(P)-dependent dehydrogenase (short-subunit alcohol dehydrogenase family)